MSTEEFRRSIASKIRTVSAALRADWDPIGRGQMEDLPADEYESYAPSVVGLIERGANDAELADHLASIESEQMGLTTSSQERLIDVARKIRLAIGASSGSAT